MDQKKVNRRDFLRLGALTTAGAALAACQPQVVEKIVEVERTVEVEVEKVVEVEVEKLVEVPAAERIELLWWCGWPGPYMQAIAKAFEDKFRNIRLELGLFYYEGGELMAAIAGGNAPDVAEDTAYLEIIARGVVLPIDDMVAVHPDIAFDDGDIAPASFEAFAWEGKHYGIPSCDIAGRQGLGFNLDLIEAAGLDPDNLPTTWEECFAWHQEITTYDSAGNLEILGFDPMAERTDACSYGDPFMWPHMWGFKHITDNLEIDVDRPETVEFLNVIKMFADDVGIEKLEGMATAFEGIGRGPFSQGKAAMRITYPSGPGGVWNLNPVPTFKWTYCPSPASREGITTQTAAGHAGLVMAGTEYPEESFELVQFLTQKEACDILFRDIGWMGPRKSWRDAVDMGKYPEHVQESIRYYVDSLTEADEVWVVTDPIEGITQTVWQNTYQAVQFGDMIPEEAATYMQEELDRELAQFMEER